MKSNLIFEIGTEELPARFVEIGLSQLKEYASTFLKEERLKFQGLQTYGTPRRLVLLVQGLEDTQEDMIKEIKGPAKKVALDVEGNFTKAAQGFARSQGVSTHDLVVKEIPQGEYIFAVLEEKGGNTINILGDLLKNLVLTLNFPKSMRWGDKSVKFARPIKWFLAIYGNEVLDFEIDGISSGNVTFGHRQLASGTHVVRSADEYFQVIDNIYCILDQELRRKMVLEGAKSAAQEAGGQILLDEDLLNEVTFLVEYPTALCGKFSPEFLEIPSQVLITTMKEHQRYFPVADDKGNLLPAFVAVRNGGKEHLELVTEGNQRVLKARLADARFFYEEDKKVPLIELVPKLQGIVFQEDLGTIAEKVERVRKLARYIGDTLGTDESTMEKIDRAVILCKADLVTNMVKEFPELQGQMGRDYAAISGEDPVVAEAIFESYLPRFAGDILPTNDVGRVVSMADKFDTVVGAFGVGLLPTGSRDPYALRRQTIGILNILIDSKTTLKLGDVVDRSMEIYSNSSRLKRDPAQVKSELCDFFRQRFAGILQERGFTHDVVEAVLEVGFDDVFETVNRAQAIKDASASPEFTDLIIAISRADRISKDAKVCEIDSSLFEFEAEAKLFEAYVTCREEVHNLLKSHKPERFLNVLSRLASLRGSVDAFFDDVMVMVEDEAVRKNRLSLLRQVADLALNIADLSKISHDAI